MADRIKTTEVLYDEEHAGCINYGIEERSFIHFFRPDTEKHIEHRPKEYTILFVKKGGTELEWPELKQQKSVGENEFILLPSDNMIRMDIEAGAELMLFRFGNNLKLCEMFRLKPNDKLLENGLQDSIQVLCANDIVGELTDSVVRCMDAGVRCLNYQSMKVTEMLYMFRYFYTKEELTAFFRPMLTREIAFKRFIFSNWDKVNSIEELASKANYHRDTFTRKFYRVMGTTPGQWMRERRAELIIHELKFSSKPLKQIAEDFDFSSPAALNTFCQKQFNDTPARIRSQKPKVKKDLAATEKGTL